MVNQSRSGRFLRGIGVMAVALLVAVATAPATSSRPDVDTTTIRRPVSYGKPNQSRLWYNTAVDRWDALIPRNDEINNRTRGVSRSDHYLMTDVSGRAAFTEVELEDRDFARPDAFWDDRSGMLYVLSSHPDDSEFWRLRHDRDRDRYLFEVGAPGAGLVVPGITHPDRELGGDSPATVHVSLDGEVWVAVMSGAGLQVQYSTDGGSTWLPQPVVLDGGAGRGVTTWVDFEIEGRPTVGLFAGENARPSEDTDFLFWHVAQGVDPTIAANWVDDTSVVPQSIGVEQSDDHVSAARDASGNLYFAVKTEGGGPTDPLIKLYRRGPTGAWAQFEITRTAEVPEQSRPSIVLDEARGEISIYVSGAEVAGSDRREAGRFTASLDSLQTLAEAPFVAVFSRPGVVFTDVITPRHPVTSGRGVVVLAHNRTDRDIWVSVDGPAPQTGPLAVSAAPVGEGGRRSGGPLAS